MASYRYERDIDPKDLTPRKKRAYTRKERWANWWDYNLKWVIILGIAAAFVGYCFIGQYFLTTHADYNVAVVAPHYLPEATQTALQDALAAYGEDRNGDGKVVVKLNVYTMNFGSDDSDAYLDMAGTTKLSTDIQGALSSIFILYDPAGFQSTTGTLRYLDGSLPQSDADNDWWNMVYHWDDCPVLAGLDLGDYTSDAVQNDSGSSQELLSHYYIGIRGAWTKDADGLLSGGVSFRPNGGEAGRAHGKRAAGGPCQTPAVFAGKMASLRRTVERREQGRTPRGRERHGCHAEREEPGGIGFSQPGHLPGQGDFLTKHGNGRLEGFGETGGRAVSEKGLAIGEKAIRYERRPVQYEGRFAPQPVGESGQSGVFPFG